MTVNQLSHATLVHARRRRLAGEKVSQIARELGVTWQALEKATRRMTAEGQPPDPPESPEPPHVLPESSGGEQVLTEKYRPRRLGHILGQDAVVTILNQLVQQPCPVAMLFEGPTGTGKTSAAIALAAELGCDVDQGSFGGMHVIAAGEQTADTVRRVYDHLWHTPFYGSGWKVLIVNEADRMHAAVETVWLDRIEHLPPRTMVVFTTNHAARLSQRLRDRCMTLHFTADPNHLSTVVRDLLTAMWRAETKHSALDPAMLDEILAAANCNNQLSIRRAVQALQHRILTTKGGA